MSSAHTATIISYSTLERQRQGWKWKEKMLGLMRGSLRMIGQGKKNYGQYLTSKMLQKDWVDEEQHWDCCT